MESFDWKQKFDASFTFIDKSKSFERYHIENDAGEGTITSCMVLPGIRVIDIDLSMPYCDNLLERNKEIIEIGYCTDGLFECNVNKRYCYFISAGDFAVGYAGKPESYGTFPTGRYKGVNIFLEVKTASRQLAHVFQELDIHMDRILALAALTPRCFVLHQNDELATIQTTIADGFREKSVPRLRVKVMEMLLFLSNLDAGAAYDTPAYLSQNQVAIARSVQKRLDADLSKHTTLETLAADLGVGITALKTSFKSVYGMPIYQYQKNMRLQKAQQLLRDTGLSVSAVAAEIGYSNPAKFSSTFKKRFGASPTEYRKHTARPEADS